MTPYPQVLGILERFWGQFCSDFGGSFVVFWLNSGGFFGFGAILKKSWWCNFRGFFGFGAILKGLLAGKPRDPLPTGFRDFEAIFGWGV